MFPHLEFIGGEELLFFTSTKYVQFVSQQISLMVSCQIQSDIVLEHLENLKRLKVRP